MRRAVNSAAATRNRRMNVVSAGHALRCAERPLQLIIWRSYFGELEEDTERSSPPCVRKSWLIQNGMLAGLRENNRSEVRQVRSSRCERVARRYRLISEF